MDSSKKKAWQALGAELAGKPPQALDVLSTADLDALAQTLHESHRAQQKQLQDSLENALSYVPALLRGTVRKVLFPK